MKQKYMYTLLWHYYETIIRIPELTCIINEQWPLFVVNLAIDYMNLLIKPPK